MTLRSADGEALIAQVRQSHVPPAEAGLVEQMIRMDFWLVCALQEAKRRVQRLRTLVFGSRAQPHELPESAASATSSAPRSPGASGEAPKIGRASCRERVWTVV